MVGATVTQHRFTVDDYYKMLAAGILTEDDRVELIEGGIIRLPPIGSEHAGRVNRLNYHLVRLLADQAIVSVQSPVRLSQLSEPQPDVAVLKNRSDFYTNSHPGPGDVHLIIEVADSSAALDREVKAALYARAGIPELWIVDVPGEVVSVYRDPAPAGYQSVHDHRRGEMLSPLAFPDLQLAVDETL